MDTTKTDATTTRPAASSSKTRLATTRTPAEVRAAETTRVAREMTDAQTEKRNAQVAKLREARMAKEAEEANAAAIAAALEPKKKAKARKKA
ncbi:hypothetical protein [Rubellimicrobium roseum]|uniref:hypothetical protein n=1 Tax=Rubellimicrobium roseum TaxID=687525 RepID=UPI00159B8BBB|nr:hypothetical protein [Rubellimicrobium roseum]